MRARVPLRELNVIARGTNAGRVVRAGFAACSMDGLASSMEWAEDIPEFGQRKR